MKKSSLIHVVWLVIAAVAFAFGRTNRSDRSAQGIGKPSAQSDFSSREGELEGANTRSPKLSATSGSEVAVVEIDSLIDAAFSDPNPIRRASAFARLLESVTAENAEGIFTERKELDLRRDQRGRRSRGEASAL